MLKIKKYIEFINESIDSKYLIEYWLKKNNDANYIINDDLSVDVDGDVNIISKKLDKIPIKYNNIKGNFDCSNNNLSTFDNFPEYVGNYMWCNQNEFISLKGFSTYIGKSLVLDENKLTNLIGLSHMNIDLVIFDNPLTTLDGLNIKFNLQNLHINEEILKWNWLESILSEDESLITYNISWIKQRENVMPDDFKEKFGHLIEFQHYTKSLN